MSEAITIGIIGGSGLYDMAELTDREERKVTTPFGDPSDPYVIGTLRGKRVAFLARHGAGHRYTPTELNYRANIFGMKMLGVEYILSASAVGIAAGGVRAAAPGDSRSVLRPDEGPRQHVLRQRPGRARGVRASGVRAARRRRVRRPARRSAPQCTAAAPTSAWKARSSRRWPSRSSIARGGWTSSA